MNVCVYTGAWVTDNCGRSFPADLFLVRDAIVVRSTERAMHECYKHPDIPVTHTIVLDYKCWDRLADIATAVIPRANLTGKLHIEGEDGL